MTVARLGVILIVIVACGRAQAQPNAGLDDVAVGARIARVQAILDERAGRAQLWQYGWAIAGYSVTAGFVAISATTADKDLRLDFAFAAGGALIDTTVHVLGSIEVHAAARLREQPSASPEELRLKLSFAEAQLTAAADAERDRRSLLKAQILPVGFSIATGLVLGIAFGHWRGAIVNTAASIVINELRVLTQPTSSIAALAQYQRDPRAAAARERQRPRFVWSVAASPLGCTLYGAFDSM
jgi:hypothetical protein